MQQFTLEHDFSVDAQQLCQTWLSSEGHSLMTGGKAIASVEINSKFEAWDGYIEGRLLEYREGQKMVFTWRTNEFDDQDPDSLVTIELSHVDTGCKLKLIHTNIPEGQASQYEAGWQEHYFIPMESYFSKR